VSDEIVLPAVIGLVVAVVLHSFQKWRDRKEMVRARHFDIYVEMVDAICGMGIAHMRGSGGDEALTKYFEAKARFAVVASDEVMERFIEFDRAITSGETIKDGSFDRKLGEFMRAARAENLGRTKLSVEDLVVVTPYGKTVRLAGTK